MMKKTIILLLLAIVLIHNNYAYAQQRKGELTGPDGEVVYNDSTRVRYSYFTDNILCLDPIEGVWKLEIISRSWNNYRRFPDIIAYNGYLTIVKQGIDYIVFKGGGSSFQRIGDRMYRILYYVMGPNGKQMTSNTFLMTDYDAFSVTLDLPLSADNVGSQAQHILTFRRIYPTKDFFNNTRNAEAANSTKDNMKESEPTIWSGTGFALKDGYIVTNYHVIEKAKSISVHNINEKTECELKAFVIATDPKNDIAIIKIDDQNYTSSWNIPYAITNETIDVGEEIWTLGYPLTQYLGSEIKLTNGLISAKSGYQGDVTTYQISAPIQPGNSGGPLFDSKGNIVGIINANVPNAENVGYAIKTSFLYNITDCYSISQCIPRNNTIISLTLSEKIKKVKNYVFLLTCSSKQ